MRTAVRRTRRLLVVLMASMALLPVHVGSAGAQGVGISPVHLQFRDALRGGTFVQSLILTNTDSQRGREFTLSAMGDVAPWIRFVEQGSDVAVTSLVAPASSRVTVGVTLQVPMDVANREYTGRIRVISKEIADPGAEEAGGTDVGIGGFVDVSVTVTGDERRGARLLDASVSKAEVGMEQRFEARVENTGNVTTQARLDVRVMREGEEVARLSTDGQNFPVLPEKDEVVFIAWPTVEERPGDYTAEFTVVDVAGAEPVEVGSVVVPFILAPRGTYTRAGTFDDLDLRNQPQPGGVAQIEAVFTNTGEIDVTSVFVGELYRGDELVGTVESRGRAVRPGETVVIEVPVDVQDDGEYRVVGKIDFEGSITDDREVRFSAGAGGGGSSRMTSILVVVGASLLLLGGLHLIRSIRARRRAKHAAAARLRAYDRESAVRRPREPVGR
jgi:hypothetical protein